MSLKGGQRTDEVELKRHIKILCSQIGQMELEKRKIVETFKAERLQLTSSVASLRQQLHEMSSAKDKSDAKYLRLKASNDKVSQSLRDEKASLEAENQRLKKQLGMLL